MMGYSVSDAIANLEVALDKAPRDAISGEWVATTLQAAVSTCKGGYRNREGKYVETPWDTSSEIIREVVDRLEESQSDRFNKVTIRWNKATSPAERGEVTLEVEFDEAIVPRGPDDPIYDMAAAARAAFWQAHGNIAAGFAADFSETNNHNQTKWGGPHRRVLAVRTTEGLTLATDGLSTPWAGVTEPQDGSECELFMEFDADALDAKQIDGWANVLIDAGDFLIEDFEAVEDVEKQGAILFCGLANDFRPLSHISLSRDDRRIGGLAFGSVPLIRATPVKESELGDKDLSDDCSARAAREALANRGIKTDGW
jgi:hypothetical protein